MDSTRERHQHSFRAYKANSPHNRYQESNFYNTPSHLRSRIQRHSLKWRKDYYHRGNYRSRLPYKRSESSSKKSNKTPEDVEEEERKKKLNDTAKKLLSKIKTWNAEKNCSEDDSQQSCNINEVVSENSCKYNDDKINSDGKPKRIAHSKKAKLAKSRTRKSFSQPAKTITRYDVNKDTVKDFQNRIQHKLIEDIMQMPKENLQHVLNDPKINPVMEKKMSRLVRENKPLIAQKLRAIAESKMKALGHTTNPQLLDDIDKLIDPVIETDLSVLPYELIKQMENIFQVQFDFSPNNPVSQVENVGETAVESAKDIAMEINNLEDVPKIESNEDLSVYECSTDEDEDINLRKSVEFECELNAVEEVLKLDKITDEYIQRTSSSSEPLGSNNIQANASPVKGIVNKEVNSYQDSKDIIVVPEEPYHNASNSAEECTSTSCQTDNSYEDASTQTDTTPESMETLYGAPIPREATDESISSLLNEVNSIQIATNKLNERRFMIFLQLAKMNPSGSFISDDSTKNNFIESVSNGDVHLVESLNQFFSSSASGRGLKSFEWWRTKKKLKKKNSQK